MERTELKPCPFCGGKAKFERPIGEEPKVECYYPSYQTEGKYYLVQRFFIRCDKCRFRTIEFAVKLEINRDDLSLKESLDNCNDVKNFTEKWNRRADAE